VGGARITDTAGGTLEQERFDHPKGQDRPQHSGDRGYHYGMLGGGIGLLGEPLPDNENHRGNHRCDDEIHA
jgi:hypothetical protein